MNVSNSSGDSPYAINNSPLHQALYMIFFTPVIIVAVLGNALVVSAVWRETSLKTPRYYILTSLAVTDLLAGVFGTPLEVFSRIVQNEITCSNATGNYFSVWYYVFGGLSIAHLVMVTVDRHLAITRPLRYLAILTPPKVRLGILVLWTGGIVYGIASILSVQKDDESMTQICSGEPFTSSSSRRFFMGTGATIISIGVVLTIINARILRLAIRLSKNVPGLCSNSSSDGCRLATEKRSLHLKACWTIFTVVGVFFLCWLPVAVWFLIRTYISIGQIAQLLFSGITFFFASLSSAVNPFIYCFKDRLFKRSFCKIIPALEKCIEIADDR